MSAGCVECQNMLLLTHPTGHVQATTCNPAKGPRHAARKAPKSRQVVRQVNPAVNRTSPGDSPWNFSSPISAPPWLVLSISM